MGPYQPLGNPDPDLATVRVFPLHRASLWAGGCLATVTNEDGGLFLRRGLVPVPDYPLPTDRRGKSSLSARWCHLIFFFLGEA